MNTGTGLASNRRSALVAMVAAATAVGANMQSSVVDVDDENIAAKIADVHTKTRSALNAANVQAMEPGGAARPTLEAAIEGRVVDAISLMAPDALTEYGQVLDTDLDGAEYDTHNATRALLDFTLAARSHITVETWDGVAWTRRDVTNVHTGTVTQNAYSVGKYRVDLAGARKVRATGSIQHPTDSAYTATLYLIWPTPIARTLYSPTPTKAVTTQVNNLGRHGFVPDAKNPGTVYCYAASFVLKSTNYGATWPTTVVDLGSSLKRVDLLDDGRLLAFTLDGKVHKSNNPGGTGTWTVVHKAVAGSNSSSFGYDRIGNTIVYAEYGPASDANNARHAYQSDDAGKTWRTIFAGPHNGTSGGTFHCHDVRIDPVAGWVWIVNGDYIKNSNIWHRPINTTGTGGWVPLFASGTAPSQWTTVVPLDDCVLFLSDSQHTAVWRWDRSMKGVTVEVAHSIELFRSPETISSNPYIDRSGKRTAAYFGWQTHTKNPAIPSVWATADGRTYHPLWTADGPPENFGRPDAFMGIYGVTGKDDQGRLYVDYRHRPEGATGPANLVRLTPPTWAPA